VGSEILVDGYNVIKRSASFQSLGAKNLEYAREQLITQLINRYRHTPHHVTIVFDGSDVHEQVLHKQRIRIIYSRHGETADSVIARLAATAQAEGRTIEMYSDDRAVQQAVSLRGGEIRTTGQLTDQLNAPSRDVGRRYKHRVAIRKKYGLDPMYYDDDEIESPHSPGKKKNSHRKR
jgi:predicted RNA-binding protein with PIN domain